MVLNNKISLALIIIAFFSGTILTSNIVPNAAAANPTLADVLAIVQDIQTKVTTLLTNVGNIQTTSNVIKTKTDNLPTDPASNTAISNAQNAINSHTDVAISSIPSGLTETQFNTLKCNASIRSSIDLSGCTIFAARFNNLDLSHADLRFTHFDFGSFDGADLDGANFAGAHLNHDLFRGANLDGTIFTNADLSNSHLENAILDFANFNGANLNGVNFNGASLNGAIFTGCTGTPIGTPSVGTLPTCTP